MKLTWYLVSTKIEQLFLELERQPEVSIAAGAYAQYSSKDAATYVHDYSLLFAASTTEADAWYAYTPPTPAAGSCYPVHGAHNFFMARTETLRRYPWHPKMSIFEHEHFFFQLYLAKQRVVSCPHVSVFHYRAPNLHDERYMSNSLRFKEAAYGLPAELAQLPVKVLALVRHSSDVVIERLQAKPIKGMSAYPECSVATISQCAM